MDWFVDALDKSIEQRYTTRVGCKQRKGITMSIEVYRLPSKKEWVAVPVTRGRKLNLRALDRSRRPMVRATTKAEVLAKATRAFA